MARKDQFEVLLRSLLVNIDKLKVFIAEKKEQPEFVPELIAELEELIKQHGLVQSASIEALASVAQSTQLAESRLELVAQRVELKSLMKANSTPTTNIALSHSTGSKRQDHYEEESGSDGCGEPKRPRVDRGDHFRANGIMLPRENLYPFEDNPASWYEFFNTRFRPMIMNNQFIDNAQKLRRLLDATPKDVRDCLRPYYDCENPDIDALIKQLRERYSQPGTILKHYQEKIVKLPSAADEFDVESIRLLANALSAVAIVPELDQTSRDAIVRESLAKLPVHMGLEFYGTKSSLKEFAEHVQERARALEKLYTVVPAAQLKEMKAKRENSLMSKAVSVCAVNDQVVKTTFANGQQQQYVSRNGVERNGSTQARPSLWCRVCTKPKHVSLFDCPVFLGCAPEGRRGIIMSNRSCLQCGKHAFVRGAECGSREKRPCGKCRGGPPHHEVLCKMSEKVSDKVSAKVAVNMIEVVSDQSLDNPFAHYPQLEEDSEDPSGQLISLN